MLWYIYILQCADQTLYVGSTSNVSRRFEEHLKLLYSEEHPDKSTAEKRETQVKRWSRSKKLALIAGDLKLLKVL